MSTLIKEIMGVRSLFGGCLPNSPSNEQIAEELCATYQDVSNKANNTGAAWQVETYTLVVTAGTRIYQLDPALVTKFYKALNVTTVPANDAEPEVPLEFTEIEYLPQEWAWLAQNQGQLMFSNHASGLVAFYRKIDDTVGEQIWAELRPTPNKTESYKILYQVGAWWDGVFSASGQELTAILPNKEYRFHFRSIVARNLLRADKVRWSYGDDTTKYARIYKGLDDRINEGKQAFEDHLATLDNSDIVELMSWSDENIPYDDGIRYR